jgi:HAD superfamily hydrolase (TIGR01549 family)
MVPEVVLFDLDDTLLVNAMETFLPAYFESLTTFARERYDAGVLVAALRSSTMQVVSSPGRLNRDVFWEHFAPQMGSTREELEPYFETFYTREFSKLRAFTQPVDGAQEVVDWFASRGVRLVLATNPVYPHSAIVHRLEWAGFAPDQFEMITTFENMYTTKPDPEYYREILKQVGVTADKAWMVGNDAVNDIEPARAVGLWTYHVVPAGTGDGGRTSGSLREWYEELRRDRSSSAQ